MIKRFELLKNTPWHKKGTVFVQYDGWLGRYLVLPNGGKGIEIVHYPADLPKSYLKELADQAPREEK